MSSKIDATVTSKGQITVPAGIREQLDIRPGDQLRFEIVDSDKLTVTAVRRRSFFERMDELRLPPIGRRVAKNDIHEAVADAVTERYQRGLPKRSR